MCRKLMGSNAPHESVPLGLAKGADMPLADVPGCAGGSGVAGGG